MFGISLHLPAVTLASRLAGRPTGLDYVMHCCALHTRWRSIEELGLGWMLQKCLSDFLASNAVKDLQNIILKHEWSQLVNSAKNHTSLKHIVCSDLVAASWCSMWDKALDLGTKRTRLSQYLFSTLCHLVFGDHICPLCESQIPSHHNYFDHLNSIHLNDEYSEDVHITG